MVNNVKQAPQQRTLHLCPGPDCMSAHVVSTRLALESRQQGEMLQASLVNTASSPPAAGVQSNGASLSGQQNAKRRCLASSVPI